MGKILIVEDDASNNQMLKEYLESHGYACDQAYSGSEGKLLFSMEQYDLVLLDLMLPGIPGEELVTLFSQKAPVIVLSAKSGLDSKVEVLSAGAEDYLCKPFDLQELLVRIQVQLRRGSRGADSGALGQEIAAPGPGRRAWGQERIAPGQEIAAPGPGRDLAQEGASSAQDKDISPKREASAEPGGGLPMGKTYTYRDWTLTPDTQEMTACGELVELTRHEFLIMELLIRNPRRVLTKQMIYEYAWGEEYHPEDKTMNVHISNIRSKLKKSGTDAYIQTVWGMGFKLS